MWEQNKPAVCANSSKQFVIQQRTKHCSGWTTTLLTPIDRVIDNKVGICIHPVYQRNSERTAEDVFTSGQSPNQGCKEQEAQQQSRHSKGHSRSAWLQLKTWIPTLSQHGLGLFSRMFAHAGHNKIGFTVIQKASIFKYFKERNVIFIFFLFNGTYKGLHTKPAYLLWDEVRKKTLKSSRLSWENDLYFLWLLKLFERHCGVWGTSVLALAAEAGGIGRRGRVCPGSQHVPDAPTAPATGHSWAHSWGGDKTPWEYLWEMYLRQCKTTYDDAKPPAERSERGKCEKQPCHQGERRRSPRGWSRDFPAPIVGTMIMQVPLQPLEVPVLGKRMRSEWQGSAAINWPQTSLPTNLCCSVGASKRVGNEGVNVRRTRGEGVLGFILVSHHINLFQSTIN